MTKKQDEGKIVKATSAEKHTDKGIELSAHGTEGFAELRPKQQVFVVEFLSNSFNATRAATAAGYAPNSAHVEGSRLVRNAKVAAVIAKAFEKHGITSAAVKILLGSVAFGADVADFEPWIKGEKTLKQLRASGVDTRAVKSATETPRSRKIELHDRLAALKELSRILGLVTNKYELAQKSEGTLEHELKQMTDEELKRAAYALRPQPEGLQYLTEEELEVWARGIYQELCQRRDGHPAGPAPKGLALLEDLGAEGQESGQ